MLCRVLFVAGAIIGLGALAGRVDSSLPIFLFPITAFLCGIIVARNKWRIDRITSAIGDFGRSLESIARGNFDVDVPDAHIPEISTLNDAISHMSVQVRETVENLQLAALRDPLTRLPNRAHFQYLVERQINAHQQQGLVCALLFIDFDGFKVVNDTMGHRVGDQILQMASERLKLATRMADRVGRVVQQAEPLLPSAHLSRLGGDEFTVFLGDIKSEAMARKVAGRVLRVLAEPFELGARSIAAGASIGVAMWPRDGDNYDQLLRAADTAMYHAKQQGRGRIECYSAVLDEEALASAELEQELRQALAENQFILHYQPLYDCRTLKIASVEALIRWNHPRRGLLYPGAFIPMAEKMSLINDIGEWVVSTAVRRIAAWIEDGLSIKVSVNVSPNQLRQMEFVALVKASLHRWNVPPALLELEITETSAMHDVELAADRLTRMRALGVSVALDDFGTGYSNLASLTTLPINSLKLDRSLIEHIADQPDARTLVQTMIGMASGLGFKSVAEGVETGEQLEMLSVMGCNIVQGYLLSRPVDEETLRTLLDGTHFGPMFNNPLGKNH